MASMLLVLLWIYYGNGEMSRGCCGWRCITSLTTRVCDLLLSVLSTVRGSVRLHHSLKEPPLVCSRVFRIQRTLLTPSRACACWHGWISIASRPEARIDLWPGISDAIFLGSFLPGFILLFLLLAGLLRSPAESVHFPSRWPLLCLLASLGCLFPRLIVHPAAYCAFTCPAFWLVPIVFGRLCFSCLHLPFFPHLSHTVVKKETSEDFFKHTRFAMCRLIKPTHHSWTPII